MRTQVGIVGAGPAGLLLSHLLHRHGIGSVVIERHSRGYVEARVRAGVIEHDAASMLIEAGVGERMQREGLVHHGINLTFAGRRHRIDLSDLTGGRTVMVYGQHEVVKDLIAARVAAGGDLRFNITDVKLHGIETSAPHVSFTENGHPTELACEFIAGCDGFHGICRPSMPASALTVYERAYPFAWLGILAEAPPASEELVYACHASGFALQSMRSPRITRAYLQCRPDENLALWPDRRIWDELRRRLEADGLTLNEGPILQRGVTPMRSFVVEPMQHGRLFLAGDAAHIVPPTGAKGMNLAIADVHVLAVALVAYFKSGRTDLLEAYSATCLRRLWKVQRFSWWMTSLLHRFPDADPMQEHLQLAELEQIAGSRAAQQVLAENYVGLPHEA
ncbi:MAG TPA: 4-hydroxybenzoate 3-monooxygenase [Hyphomicrobiaceae bacterium]|nr:4-hydroxybenzoate 3-monooxygenase [Hyphomicrobiaceae bacterium]